MNKRTCTMPECTSPHRAKGFCNTHYGQQNPNKYRAITVQCSWCQKECTKEAGRANRYSNLFCTIECRSAHRIAQTPEKPPIIRRDLRSALRKAYEAGDYEAVTAEIRRDTVETDSGCWEWQRMIKRDYGVVSIDGKAKYVHRLMLEAKHGKPLGKQAAHHACANTICCNPAHLQPVTHVENAAEMLARAYYESRIQLLEQALADASPGHPLLMEIGTPMATA